jgi:tetratricopeptide (TPR) repeat protein
MAVEFSLAEQARIEEAPTGSPEAYALLLSSYEIAGRGTREATLLALERMDRALEVDPDFASGWAAKASMHSYITAFVPERTDEHLALGEAAAQRALELDPDSTGARISLAMIATARGQWQSAAREFAATSLSESEPLAAFQFLVGHFERGLENIRLVQRHDPLNPNAAWWIVAALDALGRTDASLAEYERARELFRDWSFGDFHAFVTLLGSGQAERAMALARDELANVVVATVLESSSSPEAALAALRRLLADDETAPAQYIALFAAHLGDQALALEALEAQLERSPVGGHLLWRPIFREMRQLPAFKDLLRQEGLVAYWGEFGWPDLCRPVGDGDFECD